MNNEWVSAWKKMADVLIYLDEQWVSLGRENKSMNEKKEKEALYFSVKENGWGTKCEMGLYEWKGDRGSCSKMSVMNQRREV